MITCVLSGPGCFPKTGKYTINKCIQLLINKKNNYTSTNQMGICSLMNNNSELNTIFYSLTNKKYQPIANQKIKSLMNTKSLFKKS